MVRKLVRYEQRLALVAADRRDALVAGGASIVADGRALKRALACPADAIAE